MAKMAFKEETNYHNVKVDIFAFDRVNGILHVLNFTYTVVDGQYMCFYYEHYYLCLFLFFCVCFVMRQMGEKFPPTKISTFTLVVIIHTETFVQRQI